MINNKPLRHLGYLGLAILLTGCAVSYEAAEEKYQEGKFTEAREAWTSLADKGDTRAMHRLYTSSRIKTDADITALQQAADLDYPPAMHDYGLYLIGQERYTDGIDYLSKAKELDYPPSVAWYRANRQPINLWPLAENGFTASIVMLGEYYKDRKEYKEALHWFKKGADKDSSNALFYMGVMYNFGYGINKNMTTAADWYRKAAEKGHSSASFNLCLMYRDGNGVAKNLTQARAWCEKSAAMNNEDGTVELGRMYLYGIGGEKDEQHAFKLLSPLGNKNSFAALRLGEIYFDGLGQPQDYRQALPWFEKAHREESISSAAKYIAIMYDEALGHPLDTRKALSWFEAAAKRGDTYSQRRTGQFYRDGRGTSKNLKQAAYWFEQAAEQNDRFAQYSLGMAYLDGQGVRQSASRAKQWLTKAAEQGHSAAQFQLGYEYADGSKLKKNYQEFAKWTQLAADQEHQVAQFNLSVAYENGWGKDKNQAWAAYWRAKAANQGYQSAIETMPKLLQHLTRLELKKSTPLYQKVSTDSDKVASMKKGDIVYRLANNDSWTEVVTDKGYKLGFVPSSSAQEPKVATPTRSNTSQFPAKPAKVPGRVSCNTRCINSTCYRTYDDGREVKFQAQQKFNAFTGQFEWDSGGC
ncbi:sel1 repeat family protein [Photobacterium gaetbulicola]|uniref:Uncharacterized protein n=1 Tax=Photobacterium gaetbulicola Gung47 TaxID=658445 RepID=A0A0C5WWT2_9GAMM|nr:tetratricopeptide repeat protein [Photobacterium gaetbulicola]AJR09489.1 hypothetical protein H744_2c2836 [Photobacterium gaetbulicola Gung47]PSU14283.1 sel1 repeat family protein [Photobacterium gaetbulicola]